MVLNTLLDRAGDSASLGEVRAIMELHLAALKTRIGAMVGGSAADRAIRAKAVRQITRYFDGQDDPKSRSRYAVIPLPWP